MILFFVAGYSEDSDYTSDLNYPVGGQGANSSASQFRTAANQLATPQRSLETSRENSYERDDHQVFTCNFIPGQNDPVCKKMDNYHGTILSTTFDQYLTSIREKFGFPLIYYDGECLAV